MQLIPTSLLATIFSTLAAFSGLAQPVDETDSPEPMLEITVTNLGDDAGPVQIAIDTEETWFVKGVEPLYNFTVPRDGDQATLVVEDIEPGVYALRVYHDENDDGELDTNFLGIPKEPYGFSGEKTDRMRPRSFEYAEFTLDKPTQMTIKLR